ncbi:MAG: hypothetical protein MZV70_29180 [Desulfobacterales bacterium]|nr:hypothetical protein [Desulfobacterales bacterium]
MSDLNALIAQLNEKYQPSKRYFLSGESLIEETWTTTRSAEQRMIFEKATEEEIRLSFNLPVEDPKLPVANKFGKYNGK